MSIMTTARILAWLPAPAPTASIVQQIGFDSDPEHDPEKWELVFGKVMLKTKIALPRCDLGVLWLLLQPLAERTSLGFAATRFWRP